MKTELGIETSIGLYIFQMCGGNPTGIDLTRYLANQLSNQGNVQEGKNDTPR